MTTGFKKGDAVEWNTSQGTTQGKVVRQVRGTAHAKGHVAKATPDEPQLEVRSDKSGETALHKPGALRKAHPSAK